MWITTQTEFFFFISINKFMSWTNFKAIRARDQLRVGRLSHSFSCGTKFSSDYNFFLVTNESSLCLFQFEKKNFYVSTVNGIWIHKVELKIFDLMKFCGSFTRNRTNEKTRLAMAAYFSVYVWALFEWTRWWILITFIRINQKTNSNKINII